MLNFLIDILYLIIFVVNVIIFVKRGFVRSFFKYGRGFMAVVLTFIFGSNVSKLLFDKIVYNKVFMWISAKVSSICASLSADLNADRFFDELPFIVKKLINTEAAKEKFGDTVEDICEAANDFSSFIATPLANIISNILGYIITFLIAWLLLLIIGKLLDLMTKLPIFNMLNKILGFLFGVIASIVLLAAVTVILNFAIGIFKNFTVLKLITDSSVLFGLFNKIGLFDLF